MQGKTSAWLTVLLHSPPAWAEVHPMPAARVHVRNGASHGLPYPSFTVEDLQAADVLVTNNVSNLNELKARDAAAAEAFETAVRGGKSVLGFHASTEGGKGWGFYDEFLNPRFYISHSSQIPISVYKDAAVSGHVSLEGVLATGTPSEVPMGVDAAGKEVLQKDVTARKIKTEANNYAGTRPPQVKRYALTRP